MEIESRSGILKLWVKRSDNEPWGVLEAVSFDEASRRRSERRRGRLRLLRSRLSGWVHNYWQFRTASFCIEQQPDAYSLPFHIQGQRRDRKHVKKGGGLKRLVMEDKPRRILKRIVMDNLVESVVVEHKPKAVKEPELTKKKKLVDKKTISSAKKAARAQARKWKQNDKQKGRGK